MKKPQEQIIIHNINQVKNNHGIVAGTVNIESQQQRILSPEVKQNMLDAFAEYPDKSIIVNVLGQDAEPQAFAREIVTFLRAEGRTVSTATILGVAPPDKPFLIATHLDPIEILISPD